MRAIRLPYLLVALLLAALMAALLLGMGQPLICTCGTIDLWAGGASSPKTSQMIADWYAPSHVVHGLLFYAFFWLIARRHPVEHRYLWAVMAEAAWEVLENSPPILERYRSVTIEVGYFGDSVVNSLSDLMMMSIGFLIARKLPLWASVSLLIIAEVAAVIAIRNNLLLSTWMLVWPTDFIRDWQAAGGTLH